jgi:predicted metallo-beta-lactamase superfamily hydrolase
VVDAVPSLAMLGSESLGVRGLSCFAEYRGSRVLVDPGVALGFTRRRLHPHPIQAVAGDEVREKIKSLWKKAGYIVLTHMHGDHVPLYNANPFQLSLYSLEYNDDAVIIAPDPSFLVARERIRLARIIEVYGANVVTFRGRGLEIGPVRVYGPYCHGLTQTKVFAVLLELGERIMHLSDTELLCDDAIDLAVKLRPDIVITDGPPIYKFLHDRRFVSNLLRKAEKNIFKLSETAHIIIIDHHINRCDEGYQWIKNVSMKVKDTIVVTASEFMGLKPLLLEAWRGTLYKYYPVSNDWFKEDYMGIMERYRRIYHRIVSSLSVMEEVSEDNFAKIIEVLEKMKDSVK